VISTIHGRYYVACLDHIETAVQPSPTDAIAAWNAREFEPPLPPISRVYDLRGPLDQTSLTSL
jgi:hypothetical protein